MIRRTCADLAGALRGCTGLMPSGRLSASVTPTAGREATGCRGVAPAMLPCPAGQFLPCAGVFVETQLIEGQENHAIQYFA